MKPEVIIVQDKITHYRVPFYEELREILSKNGVRLRLLYAPDDERWEYKPESRLYVELDWAEPFTKRYLPGGATWYPVLRKLRTADLVIVEAASKRLLNYVLFSWRLIGGPLVGLWGHGWSHSSDRSNGLLESLKIWLGRRADWYFAYTAEVRKGLIARGYKPARITDVQNAVPAPYAREAKRDDHEIREALGMSPDGVVVLFCSRMYPVKRLSFLIAAVEQAKNRVQNLELILVGSGPDQGIAEAAAREHDYIRYLGPLVGERLAEAYQIARIVVMPGLVGLGVVDAFHHHVPPIATEFPFHSPEASYLIDGENGIVAPDNPTAFADAIVRLATEDALHDQLVAGCRQSASTITIEEMARRYADGVLDALTVSRNR